MPTHSPLGPPLYVRDAAHPLHVARALEDLRAGLRQWRLALALARLDVRNRYRGSVLGPFWFTFSAAIMIASLSLLYSALFGIALADYLPFITVGLLVWNAINLTVNEACGCFTSSEAIIRQIPLPYGVHVGRCVLRNAIVAVHSLPIMLVVFPACGVVPGPGALLALPGLMLLAVVAFAGCLLVGMACARFRDIAPIVANAMQLAFFMSPVLWKPELLGEWQAWLPANPFHVYIEIVRAPLLGDAVPAAVWIAALLYTALAVVLAFVAFARFRGRIAFWV